jgi:predicted phosphoribosyltransferase
MVGWCDPVKDRYLRVLRASAEAVQSRAYDERRYETIEQLDGDSVLLIDDTWAAGGHAQSAAFTLRSAGAGRVALVVIGRHVRRNYEIRVDDTVGDRLDALPKAFDWSTCAVH